MYKKDAPQDPDQDITALFLFLFCHPSLRVLLGALFLQFVYEGGQTGFSAGSGALVDHTFFGGFIQLGIELTQFSICIFRTLFKIFGEGSNSALDVIITGGSFLICNHVFAWRFVLWHVFLFIA
jgi:hypothetical protein